LAPHGGLKPGIIAAMTDVRTLHRRWMKDRTYRAAHAALAPAFKVASELIAARTRTGMNPARPRKRSPSSRGPRRQD